MDADSCRNDDDDPLSRGQVLICRVNPQLWWLVLLGTGEVAFFLSVPLSEAQNKNSSTDWWALTILGALVASVFGFGITWMIAELIRGEIRADEHGLTWRRGFGAWKSSRWDEISDYFTRGTFRIVETPQGNLDLSTAFIGIAPIVELVPRRAVNAPVRHWGRKGLRREENWSLSLSIWSKAEKWTAPLVSGLFLSYGVLGVVMALYSPPNPRSAFSIWQWYDAFALVTAVLLFGSLGTGFLWMMFSLWRERHFAWQHRDETLLLDAQGLVFSSSQSRVEARWEELRSLERLDPQNKVARILVGTDQGNFTLWALPNSRMWPQFRQLASEYAPHSLDALKKQDAQELSEDVDGERGAWSGNEVGEGARVFSFRSRTNRLILLCASIVLTSIPFLYLITLYMSASDENPFAPNGLLLCGTSATALILIILSWLWFKRTEIWADEEGLLLHSPFHRPRRVQWSSIENVGRDAFGDWVRTNTHQKIYFTHFFNPLRRDELLQLIQNRGILPPTP